MIYPIKKLSLKEIIKAIGGTLVRGDDDIFISAVSTDSRTVSGECLYIPIAGEKFDGHSFIADVCQKGVAAYLFSDDITINSDVAAIKVADTRRALLDLASYYRSLFDIPVIALTGSVGKTTTKEFVASVMSQGFKTLATKGNFNNDIGVPFTLFGLSDESELAVIEMGMSNFGEISVLSKCAKPDIAIITNIGTSHIEFLKSREGILKAKCEIRDGLKSDGTMILNGDDSYLASLRGKTGFSEILVGIDNPDCDFAAEDVTTGEDGTSFKCRGREYRINTIGIHNVYNALCAIAAADLLGLSCDAVYLGLSSYTPDGIRQNIINKDGIKIINDCYNSSPQSIKASLGVLDTLSAQRRVAVLGSIGELGEKSEELHTEVGGYIANSKTDVLICCGEDAKYFAKNSGLSEVYSFLETEDAADFVKDFARCGDAILIKASRFMKFEKISEKLLEGEN